MISETTNSYSKYIEKCDSNNGVFYLGHASILVSIEGKKVLFDPILLSSPYSDAWTFFPKQVIDQRFYDVDCVIISHIHQDHYDVNYLKKIDGHIPIFIVGGRPSFEADLKKNNITFVQIVQPEVSTEILENVYLYGVNHETNGIDSSTIIFNNEFCVYHGNDNFLTENSLKKFKQVRSEIDVACIPYAYINWYPFLLDYAKEDLHLKVSESDRLVRLYMDFCISATRILNPKLAIPFGANLILDDGSAFSEINLSVKTPFEFKAYIDEYFFDLKDTIIPMLAGDFCVKSSGQVSIELYDVYTDKNYRTQADQFLKSRASNRDVINWEKIDMNSFMTKLNQKLKSSDITCEQIVRIDLNYLGENILIEIDCSSLQAKYVSEYSREFDYHQYMLDDVASGYWLNGKRFEEIVGMRKFKIRRVPNTYSKDVIKLTMTVI
jgi:L-ascorbate metabolism protein UlaG (beta-lactamase superfamily)